MELIKEERLKQISDLEKFIKMSDHRLTSVLESLEWSVDVLKEKRPDMVMCPLNPEHRMPLQSLDRHLEKCSLHLEGYKSDDEFLSSSDFPSSPAVVFDKDKLHQVLAGVSSSGMKGSSGFEASACRTPARTSDRLFTDFSAAERSALHTYVVSKTTRSADHGLVAEDLQHLPFSETSKQSGPKSKLELLAEQRDAKRRRMNHKKVHTSRKTHTEILREVIRNQMEYLTSQDTVRPPEASSSVLSGDVVR